VAMGGGENRDPIEFDRPWRRFPQCEMEFGRDVYAADRLERFRRLFVVKRQRPNRGSCYRQSTWLVEEGRQLSIRTALEPTR
jgi:hypothetical protein